MDFCCVPPKLKYKIYHYILYINKIHCAKHGIILNDTAFLNKQSCISKQLYVIIRIDLCNDLPCSLSFSVYVFVLSGVMWLFQIAYKKVYSDYLVENRFYSVCFSNFNKVENGTP